MTPSRICSPRFATQRTLSRSTFGGRIARVAEVMGKPFTPWQRLVADVGGELLEDGTPAYREVWVTVPRQNGKTTLVLAWESDRCLNWPGSDPQRVVYSAQNGAAAADKLVLEQGPMLKRSRLRPAIDNVYRANGSEAITWKNGARIDVLRDSESSGHGKVIDLAVADEAFADVDDRREQVFIPAMSTRSEAQILGLSTAGTETSVWLKRKMELGRASAQGGKSTGIAYFEWSADPGEDPDDPVTWWGCMPALGHTMTLGVVEHARATMLDGEFRRAFLNQWTTSDERVLPAVVWAAVCEPKLQLNGRLSFAVDVNPDRTACSIAVADEAGRCELIEHRDGVDWAVERVAELAEKWSAGVSIDKYGPAAAFIDELERRRVRVVQVSGSQFAQACASFYDAVMSAANREPPAKVVCWHPALDAAAAGAQKRTTGDSWRWARRDATVDVSPLVAVTLARRAALTDSVGPSVYEEKELRVF